MQEFLKKVDKIRQDNDYISTIPGKDIFWVISRHLIMDWLPFKINFNIVQPSKFGMGINVNILDDLFNYLKGIKPMTDSNVLILLENVLKNCTEYEYNNFFKLVFDGKFDLPITIGQYNKFSNNKIYFGDVPKDNILEKFPGRVLLMEPFLKAKKVFVLLYKDYIELMDENYNLINSDVNLEPFLELLEENFSEPLLLFGYLEDKILTLSDVISPSIIKKYNLVDRSSVMLDLYDKIVNKNSIFLIERILCNPGEYESNSQLYKEMGYNGVRLRYADHYFFGSLEHLIYLP